MATEKSDTSRSDSVDYQLGQHDVAGEGVDLGEGSEFLPWDLEVQTAFKRLAIDIYSSDESGLAEPLTNGTATLIEAVEEGFLDSILDGEVVFEVQETPVDDDLLDDPEYDGPETELELTISDNGMGMTEATIRKVLRVLGRTLTKDSGNRSGQFGMGFAAIFLLVGWGGALELHTHSRRSDEGPISAVINNRGITLDHEQRLPNRMGSDEYGTKLMLILKDEIDTEDLRSWARKNGEYARTPITYRELDEEGNETYSRTFGMKQLEADFDENSPLIVYEDEFIRAVMSPDADGRTLNLDVPIRRGYTSNGPLPWSFDIRIKNENQPIVVSPDSERLGLFVTERGEYEGMDASRKEKYTYEVRSDEIAMAGVSGTRDTLKPAREFWNEYVIGNLYSEYSQEVQRVLSSLNTPEDITSLSHADLVLLKQAVNDRFDDWVNHWSAPSDRSKDDYTAERLITDFEDEYDASVKDEISRLLVALKRDVTVVSPNHPVDDQPADNQILDDTYGTREAWEVAEDADGRVFMGVSLHQKKADVVWDDNPDNFVVQLDSASEYDVFETALGWERLADVKRTTIDDFDISDELRSEFESNVGTKEKTSTEDTKVTLTYRKTTQNRHHRLEWKIQRVNVTAQTLRDDFENTRYSDRTPSYGGYSGCKPRLLVLFPDSGEENVSDYYWLASQDLAIAKVSDDVAEYLTWADSIILFEDYLETAETYTLQTSEGLRSLGAGADRILFHLMADDVADRFRNPDVLDGMPKTLLEMYEDSPKSWPRKLPEYDFVYAPITRDDLLYARYHLRDETDACLITGDQYYHIDPARRIGIDSDTQMYARSALLTLDSTPDDVREFFTTVEADLESGGMTVVDALVEHYSE